MFFRCFVVELVPPYGVVPCGTCPIFVYPCVFVFAPFMNLSCVRVVCESLTSVHCNSPDVCSPVGGAVYCEGVGFACSSICTYEDKMHGNRLHLPFSFFLVFSAPVLRLPLYVSHGCVAAMSCHPCGQRLPHCPLVRPPSLPSFLVPRTRDSFLSSTPHMLCDTVCWFVFLF